LDRKISSKVCCSCELSRDFVQQGLTPKHIFVLGEQCRPHQRGELPAQTGSNRLICRACAEAGTEKNICIDHDSHNAKWYQKRHQIKRLSSIFERSCLCLKVAQYSSHLQADNDRIKHRRGKDANAWLTAVMPAGAAKA
jgi:hypothetical protein